MAEFHLHQTEVVYEIAMRHSAETKKNNTCSLAELSFLIQVVENGKFHTETQNCKSAQRLINAGLMEKIDFGEDGEWVVSTSIGRNVIEKCLLELEGSSTNE